MAEIHLFWRIYLAMSVNMDENDKSRIASSFARLHIRMQRYRPSDSAITTPRRLPQRHLAKPRLSFSGNGYWSSNVTRRRDSTTPGLFVGSSSSLRVQLYMLVFTGVKVLVNVSFTWASSSRERDTYLGGKEEVFLKVRRRGGVPICISNDQNNRNDSEIMSASCFYIPKQIFSCTKFWEKKKRFQDQILFLCCVLELCDVVPWTWLLS